MLRNELSPTLEAPAGSPTVASDTRGCNFFDDTPQLRALLELYLEPDLLEHLTPRLRRLGGLAANELDELAATAERHPPVLLPRDKEGRDCLRVDYHPAYHEMSRLGFGELGLAAMSHRGGILGWPEPIPHPAKYAFVYLFAQAEFGLLCPISMTDTTARVLIRYASPELKARYLPGLLSTDESSRRQGAMFLTEKSGGSDVGATTAEARQTPDGWRLFGEKWFCSNVDADVILLLARPQGRGPGTRGLGLFLMPRLLEGGKVNRYRIVRLKDKLGSRSMATGEVVLEGALAYPVGNLDRGFHQMAEMINLSRLSNGVRSAGLMRRSLRDALHVARKRHAFGKPIVEHPLLRRQLLKILLPAEEALSFSLFSAQALERADRGNLKKVRLVRLLTPLLKFRACRDARRVCGDAMEVRGGCGYVEEWVNPRLVRDAHLGSIWEGTSNMVALDAVVRAVGRERCHEAWSEVLAGRLHSAALPSRLRRDLSRWVERSARLAWDVATGPEAELYARQAASVLYHTTCAVLLAWEGASIAERRGDARRLLLARMVLKHGLGVRDPLLTRDGPWQRQAADLLLGDQPVSLEDVGELDV